MFSSFTGCVFFKVTISKGRYCVPDDAHTGYQFAQARGVAILDTKGSPCGDIGLVAVIPVGMGLVRLFAVVLNFPESFARKESVNAPLTAKPMRSADPSTVLFCRYLLSP